jgi:hypothetical protein
MSSALLDTRTHYQSEREGFDTSTPASLVGSAGLTLFQRLLRQMVESIHADRAVLREKVVSRLNECRDPMRYIDTILDECIVRGGPEGLEIAVDVLSKFGSLVLEYSLKLLVKDRERWKSHQASSPHVMTDDVWYVLLRSAASSDLERWMKLPIIRYCLENGTPSIREACVCALGDLDPIPVDLLRIASHDENQMVRQAAADVLEDLED